MDAPEVRYARSGDANIAYQVVGDGPVDLLYIPGWVSNLDLYWQEPSGVRFLRRIAATFRLILFDRRGTGLSDRIADEFPTLEQRRDEARDVLDAAGSEQAVVFAQGYGGPYGIAFAASCPDRLRSLILYNPVAKTGEKDDEYPWGSTPAEHEEWLAYSEANWGTEEFAREWLARLAPSAPRDEARLVAWYQRIMRAAANPGAFRRFAESSAELDVRDLLPMIRVPTLVLQREDTRAPKGGVDVDSLAESTWIADRIPDAKLVTIPGRDYLPWIGDQEALVAEIAAFGTGTRPPAEIDRVLLTVLFTDIVGSTGHLARLGDQRWKELLAEHDLAVRATLEEFGGRFVDSTGDGVFAVFDGPGRAVRAAQEIGREAARLGLEIRAGVHTGEAEVSGDRVSGIAVHIGARIVAEAGAGEVVVSSTVKDLVAGSGLDFEARGATELKGVPGAWELYSLQGSSSRA